MKGYTLTEKAKKNLNILKLFFISLVFVCVALAVAIIVCNYIGNRNFKETFYSVSSLKVDNKIRIIQISDLHNSIYGKDNKKLVSRVEKLKPDLILYTGDIIDSNSKSNDKVLNLCKELTAYAPSYYIYGNNEVEKYYDVALNQDALDEKFGFTNENRDPSKLLNITDELTQKLEASGVKVLKNKSDSIMIGTTMIDVYGVLTSNPSAFWSYAGKTFSDYIYTNENNLKITAIHEPTVFEEHTSDTWGDLVLAGHNHGGTIRIPILGAF